jgi:hypothetical protein
LKLRLAKLPVEKKVLKTLPENDLKLIEKFKPTTFVEENPYARPDVAPAMSLAWRTCSKY